MTVSKFGNTLLYILTEDLKLSSPLPSWSPWKLRLTRTQQVPSACGFSAWEGMVRKCPPLNMKTVCEERYGACWASLADPYTLWSTDFADIVVKWKRFSCQKLWKYWVKQFSLVQDVSES